MIRRWMDALAPHDMLIPRRLLALVYLVAVMTLTSATVIGFLGGYMIDTGHHAEERAVALSEYTRQLDIKDARINALTWQIIEAQEAMTKRAMRTDEMISGVLLTLEHLAENVAKNRANTRQLNAVAAELRRLRTVPRPVQKPPHRPQVGPPPQTPLLPENKTPTPPNLYLN